MSLTLGRAPVYLINGEYHMKYYIIKRLLFLIPMIFIVTFIVFLLTASSGEHQALVLLKAQGLELVSDELIAKTVKDYGFDRPVVIRYFE